MEKYCKYCKEIKDISCFTIRYSTTQCKECRNKISKEKRGFKPISELKERICNVCNILKPIEEFRIVRHKPKDYPDTKCLKCYNLSRIAYNKDKYLNNKKEILEKNKKLQKDKRYSYYRWRNLTNDQLKLVLRRQGCNNPDDSLLEAKKQQILLIRQIKENEKMEINSL